MLYVCKVTNNQHVMPSNKKTGSGKSKSKYQMKYKGITSYAAASKVISGAYPSQEQKDRAASEGQVAQNRLTANANSVLRGRGNNIDGDGMLLTGTPYYSQVEFRGGQKKINGKKKTPTPGTTKAKTARAQGVGGGVQKMTPKRATSVPNPTKPKATLQGRGSANAQILAKAAATPQSKKSKRKNGR